ncbi:ER lumen protein-retaining receptor [Favolaschia claudopus]|uniref:ER lumen protein-retaining receptor n=1 Tax=Favolaschia claudopus TaxID=2862362 RepID=A0AAW0EAK1_9AGAR
MKRGFLNHPRPTGNVSTCVPPANSRIENMVSLPIGKDPNVVQLPFDKFATWISEVSEIPALTFSESDPHKGSPQDALIIITTLPIGAPHDEPVSECVFHPGSKEVVMAIPNFPRPLLRPKAVAFRLGPAPGKGLGLFSTRALKMGELIHCERPLLVGATSIPSYAPASFTREMFIQHYLNESEQYFQVAVNRMRPADKAAFMALANSHTRDGSGPIMGIIRTNALTISGLRPGVTDPSKDYSGICEVMSRLNHSCSANTCPRFDLPSFSFRLYAVRDIAEGEELTYSYVDPLASAAQRQQGLRPYDLVCTCAACTDPATSDPRRAAIKTFSPDTVKWALDPQLPDNWLIRQCLDQLVRITKEGMGHNPQCFFATKTIMEAYICLGDAEQASKWAVKLFQQIWTEGYDDEFATPSEFKALVDPKNVAVYTDHLLWRTRFDPAAYGGLQIYQLASEMSRSDDVDTVQVFVGPYSLTLDRVLSN